MGKLAKTWLGRNEIVGISKGAIATAILFWVVMVILLIHRHYSMYPAYVSFDQGIFNQLFWNGTHGRLFQSSLSSTLSTPVVHDGDVPTVFYHRLGQHFTPALILWLPLYALIPSHVTLLILQVTLMTAAGLVLYRLARQYLEPERSTLITASFYAANAVIGPTLANFHDLSQLPLFLFSALLALEKRQWWVFWLFVVLVLAIREDTGVVLFGVGFYLILSRRYPQVGLAVCTISLGYMLLLTNLIMPLFSDDISRRFMIEQFGPYIEGDEASTIDVIWGILTNPGQLLTDLVTPWGRTFKYLLGQWLPLAFIPAISPAAWCLTAFSFLKLFIRDDSIALSINLRYALNIVPALFYGTILWWSAHPRLTPTFRRVWLGCIGLSLLFTMTSNPNRALSFIIPDSFEPQVYVTLPRQWEHVESARSLMDEIPADASVSATTHLVPHLSSRREIVRFPALKLRNDAGEDLRVDYVLVDIWQLEQYQVAFADDRQELERYLPRLDRLVERNGYGIIGFNDGIVLLKRSADANPEALAEWQTYRKTLNPIVQTS
ncbi:MAG TPA: DUF2079 domain-containing protein [Elainellaceae cyanobacterium]|jgi:uncharacterized membrane protein